MGGVREKEEAYSKLTPMVGQPAVGWLTSLVVATTKPGGRDKNYLQQRCHQLVRTVILQIVVKCHPCARNCYVLLECRANCYGSVSFSNMEVSNV